MGHISTDYSLYANRTIYINPASHSITNYFSVSIYKIIVETGGVRFNLYYTSFYIGGFAIAGISYLGGILSLYAFQQRETLLKAIKKGGKKLSLESKKITSKASNIIPSTTKKTKKSVNILKPRVKTHFKPITANVKNIQAKTTRAYNKNIKKPVLKAKSGILKKIKEVFNR